MAGPDLDTLSGLLDEAKCFALVRQHRWPEGVRCPGCGSASVVRDGRDEIQPQRQRYRCKACAGRFDDLTGTVLAGHHQPLRVWVLCLDFMGLNLANWRGSMRLLWRENWRGSMRLLWRENWRGSMRLLWRENWRGSMRLLWREKRPGV